MFLDELTPLVRELTQEPLAFLGGFFSGVFRLSLADDPVKSWLDRQVGVATPTDSFGSTNGKSSGPQSIAID